MKRFLLVFLFCPILSFSQYIRVSTDGGLLNVRSSFSVDSKIINTLEDNSILVYDNDFRKGWIKIVADDYCWYNCVEGWVSSDYISSPNFISNILRSINMNDEFTQSFLSGEAHYGDGGYIENVDGTIILQADKHIYVNLRGDYVKLDQEIRSDAPLKIYSNNQIKVSIFTMIERPGGDLTTWSGFLIINYKGKEEVIIIKKYYSYLMGHDESGEDPER